ncbi:aspartate carbamoyltransferase catalytic subunit [Tuwongella immobilis]|uniref:Aspartate carbamoyltransferase n=1 Tax=Tuwongella immobilis TaxID=692036 RepID=A0A6C2YPR9_9BACT|nr:aspartate carbamoyltransferase catalytic subunit [Tuwongella immobilis]VIP03347.1 aspartate carbamoyltransferase : Aspartate carbamoyltransferase OS=Planctomyces limnophilus (strain ATCC 43296 / DSM 3776 / IFAM 1008 / 290) GN=pyrB PE=3 SV=1: OTCace_N: OTCace [Tuwongella immobilis]VTS04066.1 aspartate carbamoyltransferase : Aspartate carbamoyltransferase OS=Planctomyces limnophilus (strain ATCC 43296 / DSM 3776 / IFAM 1008 / 290) GN=pyrB PE=3 SV=1: OTCace_N: OTCace [Tuwongella immobilis]
MSDGATWNSLHLLGLEDYSIGEIEMIFKRAEEYLPLCRTGGMKRDDLKGKMIANLFFESSTRTRMSFSLAARRLGADTMDFAPSGSSISKGETFIDTARNIEAMGVDIMVVRHASPGAPHLLSRHLNASIVNAGDGAHSHPTQGLLDIFTIRQHKGDLKNLTVALVGDILHSRVARSNINGLLKFGARVIVCGPPTLVPDELRQLGVQVAHNLDAILPECDVVNMLRIQFERQRSGMFPSIHEYALLFGMNSERLARAKKDLLLLAPGPINRGVEITPEVADGSNSVILEQVTNGLAIRMAVLSLIADERTKRANQKKVGHSPIEPAAITR